MPLGKPDSGRWWRSPDPVEQLRGNRLIEELRMSSEIVRVLDSLTRRGLVDWSGDRTWIYLGDIPLEREAEWIGSGHKPVPAEDIVRFWAIPRRI